MPDNPHDMVEAQAPPLVAIGGSAGSLDALMQFFQLIPEACGVAFLVAVHLSPRQESLLPELLQRCCALKVLAARTGQPVLANRVYVITPGTVLAWGADGLHVTPQVPGAGKSAVLDTLFASITGLGHGPIAGILLSGADTDGADGLRQVKQAGGQVLVQDPEEAQQDTMPRAAIANGCDDAVLRVVEMPGRLLPAFGIDLPLRIPPARNAASQPLPVKLTSGEKQLVHDAVQSLQSRTGHDFSSYRPAVVLRHLHHRMARTDLEQPAAYIDRIESDAAEPQALLRELLVSVTEFFRDQAAFEALARYLPGIFEGKGEGDFVRVWVPACATGEEAYSIAMLLLEHAGTLAQPPCIQVFGCDMDDAAIETARTGLYCSSAAEQVGPARLQRFFSKEAEGYRVRPELRQVVLFAQHDVVMDQAFTCMDLISCRNLLLNLTPEAQQRVADIFDFALGPQGLLFLGPVEALHGFRTAFYALDTQHRIYRRSKLAGVSRPVTIQRALGVGRGTIGRATRLRGGRAGANLNQLQEQLYSLQQHVLGDDAGSAPVSGERQQLQAITHELRANLEELEVNRQELRSMNSELSAANLVLGEKLGELELANRDLNHLMDAAAIPMVLLDRQLKIMRFTPRALDLFRLIPSDIGRSLSDLQNSLDYPQLLEHAARVVAGSAPIEQEVKEASGKWFLARALPYRAQPDAVAGVVLTFFDLTERKRTEAVYEMSTGWPPAPRQALAANSALRRYDWKRKYLPDVELPRVWAAIQRVVRRDGCQRWILSRAPPLLEEQGRMTTWFGAHED